MAIPEFILTWGPEGTRKDENERQAAQAFFIALCNYLDVPAPGSQPDYIFEKNTLALGQPRGYADVFWRDKFAWENKGPGKNLDAALRQLQGYSLALANPPLLVVSDRFVTRIHTQFNGHPSETFEVLTKNLDDPRFKQLLRRVWTDPESFRPKQTNRDITERAAQSFAKLAEGLRKRGPQEAEAQKLHAEKIAHFLTQTLFCFFAEDVGLLPRRMVDSMVSNRRFTTQQLTATLQTLFETMRKGGPFGAEYVPWFNGGLFNTIDVPKLEIIEVTELRNAAKLNWRAIDVSIFGTLFERGLDPAKRSQLGAHYTDPATIERIIDPVVRRPLVQRWAAERGRITAELAKSKKHDDAAFKAAQARYTGFLQSLADFKVLDPACGSGNFLYLGLKALKDFEHQVITEAETMGLDRPLELCTSPANMLGIEINEYAAELARVTVWIGELQWRTEHGYPFKEDPILEPLDFIEHRDALIAWEDGKPVEAQWPEVSVVIGNPPFLGGKKYVGELGERAAGALRSVYAGRVPGLADLVCHWFERARTEMLAGKLSAAGFVATNSIRDGFGREVLKRVNRDTPIYAAWSDEPWVNEGAAVRVSIVAFSPHVFGRELDGCEVDRIAPDLTQGGKSDADLTTAQRLAGNARVAFQGATRSGPFDVPGQLARHWLSQPNVNGRPNADVVRPWSNGLDVTRRPSDTWIIDFGTGTKREFAQLYELPFAHCDVNVRPTRLNNRNPKLVEQFWHYDGVRVGLRAAVKPLTRYIVTPITAKYRSFVWFHPTKLPDATLIGIARSDDATFGVLHSRFHEAWSLRVGAWLGVGNDPRYTPTSCFETFHFPLGLAPLDTAHQKVEQLVCGSVIPANLSEGVSKLAIPIAQTAKRLNDLRERWLNPPEWTQRVPEVIPLGMDASPYPDRIEPKPFLNEADAKALQKRTLTNLYNQRPAWLALAHAELDRAVAAAYGWTDYTPDMSDDEILKRLLQLNLAAAG